MCCQLHHISIKRGECQHKHSQNYKSVAPTTCCMSLFLLAEVDGFEPTTTTRIFSSVLYQLSYTSKGYIFFKVYNVPNITRTGSQIRTDDLRIPNSLNNHRYPPVYYNTKNPVQIAQDLKVLYVFSYILQSCDFSWEEELGTMLCM